MHNTNVNKALLAILLLTTALISGCGGGGGGGGTNPPPPPDSPITMQVPKYTLPKTWTATGGQITITTVVLYPNLVSSVYATVVKPDSTTVKVNMTLSSGNTYSGTYWLPADYLQSTYVIYRFSVTAVDKNNISENSGSIDILPLSEGGGPNGPGDPIPV